MRCREVLVLAAVAGVALTAAPPPAGAHLQQTGVEATLASPSSPGPGVSVGIDHSIIDLLIVTVRSGPVVEVEGTDGRPFLRIGPSGVDALTGSADWQVAERVHLVGGTPFAHVPADGPAPAATATAGWTHVSDQGSWGWPDPRLRPTDASGLPLVGVRWAIGAHRGTDALPIDGAVRRVVIAGEWDTVIDPASVAAVPGLALAAVDGRAPSLVATFSGTATVIIVGADGAPLVRLGRDGSDVNTSSVTWALTAALAGVVPVPPLGSDLPPRWVHDGAAGMPVEWVEPRLDYPAHHPRGSASHPVTVTHWSVPLLVNGAPATITGTTDWQAYATSSAGLLSSPAVQATGVLAAGAVIGVAFLVSRRRRSPTATRPSVTM